MRFVSSLLCLLLLAAPLAAQYNTGRQPMKAAVLSLAIPGGGQFYNGKWVKLIAVLSLEGFFIGQALYYNSKMNDAYDNAQGTSGDEYNHWVDKYNDNYNNRQSAYWWLGTTIFLSILDAFVDAHLYNYEAEKQRLRLEVQPDQVSLSLRF